MTNAKFFLCTNVYQQKYLTEFSKLPTNLTGTMNIVHEYARQMKKFPKDFFGTVERDNFKSFNQY